MARRVYKVKIGNIWLTEGAVETGKKCALEIINIARLRESHRRFPIESVDGTQVVQTFEVRDVPFSVVARMPKALGEMLMDLYNDAAESGALVSFEATGGGGSDFSFDCEFVSFDYADTQSDVWDNVRLNLIKK